MNKKIWAFILFASAALFTLFIFFNSAKVAEASAAQSNGIVERICDTFTSLGLKTPNPDTLSFIIRKTGHFAEYFLLGFLSALGVTMISYNKIHIVSSPIYCFSVALLDEFAVQAATEGRSPEWRDCFIDLTGALLSTGAVILIVFFYEKRRKRI